MLLTHFYCQAYRNFKTTKLWISVKMSKGTFLLIPFRDLPVSQDDQERKETWEIQESMDEMWDTRLYIVIQTAFHYALVLFHQGLERINSEEDELISIIIYLVFDYRAALDLREQEEIKENRFFFYFIFYKVITKLDIPFWIHSHYCILQGTSRACRTTRKNCEYFN